jgi:glycosyltransferase involved in cell wall biosynthesis
MPRVLDRHPDARLLLPGEPAHHATHHDRLGPDRERVLAAVDDLGVRDMDEMPAIYRSATVSLLPSRHEALGISLAESLACGTPVVCSDDGGMPSIVDRPSVGRVFAPDDVEALSSALVEAIALAADRATPPACVQSAWRYDWETVVGPMHEQAYRRLLDRRRVTAAR